MRVYNFSAGPATLPLPVLQEAQRDLLAYPGAGMSVLEMSHRSPRVEGILEEAEANLRGLLGVPETHRVLFLQGGASLQFTMVPMNLLRGAGRPADYVITGTWARKALVEARREGDARVAWDGAEAGYVRAPEPSDLDLAPGAAYVHLTSNETIQGVQFPDGFERSLAAATPAPLVCDASSDFLARPLDVASLGLVYAGAQKNAGPAGVTVVILRESLLEGVPEGLPAMLDYRTHVRHGSLYNTPPVFAVYVLLLVTRWLRDEVGGLHAMAERNRKKAALLYEAIDASGGFYRGHAEPGSRSLVNVTFRLPSEELERAFLAEAEARGLVELRGHRSVGGIRASIYNAMPVEGVEALRGLMDDFHRAHA